MKAKILVLGVSGMLGHMLFKKFRENPEFDVYGTSRDAKLDPWFTPEERARIRYGGGGVDAENFNTIIRAMASVKPDIVVNCIGIIKQLGWAQDPLTAITVNALFPQRLSMLCSASRARLIHFSTDCVFSGKKGGYVESDESDATDLYGRCKFLGELNYDHCVTIRSSIIGHELKGHHGLVGWFLAQKTRADGYRNVVFSGFPTPEVARIVGDFIIPNPKLSGIYHVASTPISKLDLLSLINEVYGLGLEIVPVDEPRLDRSLDSSRFAAETGYRAPEWRGLVELMRSDRSYSCAVTSAN